MAKEWWENFFSGVFLDLWRAAISEERTRAEGDFLQQVLKLSPPGRVLDAPCGNGRLSLDLASRGYQLTGVDIAADFTEEARAEAVKRNLSVVFEQRDMRDLHWDGEFDGVFSMGNSFGYFDDEGNIAFLKAVARTLKPGGRFALDAMCAETILPRFEERTWAPVGDILFIEENHYDHVEGRYVTDYSLVRDGRVEKKTSSHRIYSFRELCRLLNEAGFENCQSYGSLNREPFRFGSAALLFVATRKAA